MRQIRDLLIGSKEPDLQNVGWVSFNKETQKYDLKFHINGRWVPIVSNIDTIIYNAIQQNTVKINSEINRAKGVEAEINSRAVDADSLNVGQEIDGVRIDFATLDDGAYSGDITIPAATAEKAGVMSAGDKVSLDACKIIDIENEDLAIEEGFYSGRSSNGTRFYIIVHVSPLANKMNKIIQYKFVDGKVYTRYAIDSLTLGFTWYDWTFVNKEEIDKIKDGDIVVGQAREIYSEDGRSLVGEIRNFLDRLMTGFGTSDATAVADRILAMINPTIEPVNVEPEPIEE